MVNLALLGAFIPTFLFVSVTPGMCMTLAMTLGMSQGVRRTLWMMWGNARRGVGGNTGGVRCGGDNAAVSGFFSGF
ncbi:hypothetical protein [Rheinheimera sp.]|uniref:hypothetical protein n=1 Tax=Rheinheimera sp. TaxID=1869214 RepID=UPI003AF88E57